MPAQWTAEIIGEMHLYGITALELSSELGMNPKYVSSIMNGKREPKNAEVKFKAALSTIISRKEKQHTQ